MTTRPTLVARLGGRAVGLRPTRVTAHLVVETADGRREAPDAHDRDVVPRADRTEDAP